MRVPIKYNKSSLYDCHSIVTRLENYHTLILIITVICIMMCACYTNYVLTIIRMTLIQFLPG